MLLRFCFVLGKELIFPSYYDFASFWEKNSCFASHLAIFLSQILKFLDFGFWTYNLFSLYFMLLRFCFILRKKLMFSKPFGHFLKAETQKTLKYGIMGAVEVYIDNKLFIHTVERAVVCLPCQPHIGAGS